MTHPGSGNPTWKDYPDTTTMITATTLENIEFGIDATKWTYRSVSASTTANKNEKLYVDASGGARVITVPASPVAGTRLFVAATAATTTNTVTLNWTINGDTGGVQLTAAGAGVHVSYNGTGWFIDYPTTSLAKTGSSAAPSSAGFRNGYYSPTSNQYTPSSGSLRPIHGYMGQAATGSLINVVCTGDSRTAGYFQSGGTPTDAYPSRLRARLAAQGVPSAGTGLVMACNNATINDSRVVYSGGSWTNQYPYKAWGATGSNCTFTSDVAGSIVEVYYYSNSGTFTVKVGAGSAQTVTPAGGTNVAMQQYTGQSVSVGTTIVFSSTSASGGLIGFCVRNSTGVLVHSVAWGGATSSTIAGTGALTVQGIISYINPSILGVMIGCNDPSASISSTTFASNLNTILNTNNPNSTKFLIVESPTPGSDAGWQSFVSAQYDQADSLNAPLIDLNDRWVSSTLGTSAGLLGADGLHETIAGAEDLARTLARMLTT